MKKVYLCHDTITGIYSALYDAWLKSRDAEAGIGFAGSIERQLFCEYHEVVESEKKAAAVERLIQNNLGYSSYWDIYHALLAEDPDKADAVFRTMQAARTLKDSRKIMEHLSNEAVVKVFELSRKVTNEAHLFQGFVRFRELENGVLFSEISPKSQVLTCVADYFSDRFPMENWMIYDKVHRTFLVHHKQQRWFLLHGGEVNQEALKRLSGTEDEYERLWKGFCTSISIKERENRICQRNHLPHRFRADMTEFSG